MCLILFSNNHPDYKLIIAANRDEFYNRPTKKADFWADQPGMLAGKDVEAGGTWMGITTKGRISMLTNYRDLSRIKENAPSRGHLVSDFLTGEKNANIYLTEVERNGDNYNGFNLICGTPDELWYYGNYQKGVHQVSSAVHGLSNAVLNTSWPKVEKGKRKLTELLNREPITTEGLFSVLLDDHQAKDNALPDTGVGLEKERVLSPMFIKSPGYGSRCSTAILIDKTNKVTFAERTYDPTDYTYDTVEYSFLIEEHGR